MAQVIPLRTAAVESEPVRLGPEARLDDWGRDPVSVQRATAVARLRWHVAVGGEEHLPARGGALIVVNDRRWSWSPLLAALALGERLDRPVRCAGRPDIAPIGPLARRIGGLLAHPDEIAGALRGGEIVVLGASPTLQPNGVGAIDHRLIGAAVLTATRVYPAVVTSSPISRSARVEVGGEVRAGRRRRGPLAELELADAAERRLQTMLDEFGSSAGAGAVSILRWLPLGGLGDY